MQPMMKVFTLGGLEILLGDEPVVHLGSRKAAALIVYLIGTARPQSREVLADLLWDDRSQSQALSNLRGVLTLLRKHFDPYFVITRESVTPRAEAHIWLDVAEFEAGLKAVREGGGITTKRESEQAGRLVDLYQGEFLQGFYVRQSQGFDAWMVQERERLHQLALNALTDLVTYHLENGHHQAGIARAARLLELDPLMESAHRQMMHLLARSGKRDLALKQYETLCQVLGRELGIQPDDESRQLCQDLRDGRITAELSQPEVSSQTEARPRHNLPPSLTPLIGRESDLRGVVTLLKDPTCRLVTLIGPGGIGKTRLALLVAESLLPDFPQGAWFVPLDSLDSAGFLAEAVVTALDLPLSGQVPPADQLLESLRHKDLLLVLDNFEQLLPQGTGLLIEILQAAPGAKLLITSRERLNLQAEYLYNVHGLDHPEDGQAGGMEVFPAVTLFHERAHRATGLTLPDEDGVHVARIARLVEGSPLALELAAAWTRALSPAEIAGEIERGLSFLQARQPDLPARHRSMRTVFAQSSRLLSDEEKAVFRRLSVFRGGFDRKAAGQVAGASLDVLAALVDKSLVHHQPGGRYRIHALLRQFASDELELTGDTADAHEWHLRYFLQLAEQAEPKMWGTEERAWLDRLEIEYDNLRRALEWSLSPQSVLGIPAGLDLMLSTENFIRIRGKYGQSAAFLEAWLAHPQAVNHPKVLANALMLAAWLNYWVFGNHEEARKQFERGLAIAHVEGDPLLLARVLSDVATFYNEKNEDPKKSQAFLERSLTLYTEIGYQPGIATTLRRLGHISGNKYDYAASRAYYRESLRIFQALGQSSGIAQGLFELGRSLFRTGERAQARVFLEESLALFRELNPNFVDPTVLVILGLLEFAAGQITRAAAYFEEVLAESRHFGIKRTVPAALFLLGDLSRYQGDYARAPTYYDQALLTAREIGDKEAQAWVRTSQGCIYLHQGDRERARRHLEEALLLCREIDDPYDSAVALIGFAGLSAVSRRPQRAARLLGAAREKLDSTSAVLANNPADLAEYERSHALVREQLDEDTFDRLLQEGRAMAAEGLDHVVAYALDQG